MKELTQNKYQVIINGVDYTASVPFPLRWSNLLNEQLDEGALALVQTTADIFKPLTNVTISVWNEKNPLEKQMKYFVVASDTVELSAVFFHNYLQLTADSRTKRPLFLF